MRKFLFFLLCLPALASLGHDCYVYYEEQEKGFRLSDLGALWDKHHKESHDQWKIKVQEIGENVDELLPENIIPEDVIPSGMLSGEAPDTTNIPPTAVETNETTSEIEQPTNSFSQGFTQSIGRDGKTDIKPYIPEDNEESSVQGHTRYIISTIGYLLEQKAIVVLGIVPLFFFILNFTFSLFAKVKEEKSSIKGVKKKKRKGGGYSYSRK